jgi:site-specific recombinase XerD
MTSAKTKTKLWPPIHKLTYTSGKIGWQVACMLKGHRIRETFGTKEEAEKRAAQIRAQVEREGAAAFNIPLPLRVEAAECSELLQPYNSSIREACRHYVDHVLKYRNAPTISDVVAKLIADAVAAGRREKTTTDLRYRLGAFAKTYGKRKLSEIGLEELQAWSNDPTLSARSRRHMLTKLSQLYRYAEKRGWCEKNIATYVARPDVPDGEPGFLTVEQCARLLERAPDHDLLPYVALSLYAGIRVAELRRLTWEKVKLEQGVIIIDGAVAKTKSRRIIDLNDTARAWLTICGKRTGLVVDPINFRKRNDAMMRAAEFGRPGTETKKEKATSTKLEPWPDNAMRHTAATYAYALTQDAIRVAAMLGHSPDVLHRHYRGLATKADAERFFALRPAAAVAEKIVPMKAVNG